MLEELDVKESYWGKYKNTIRKPLYENSKNIEISKLIISIWKDNLKQYGYRRIKEELKTLEITVNSKKIRKIMKYFDLEPEYSKKNRRISKRRKTGKELLYDDFVERRFSSINKRFQVLYTDVTYLIFENKRAYQSTIIDAYTKEILDYKISFKNDTDLVLANLADAVTFIKLTKKDLNGIVIHSDHGSQYTSHRYKAACDSVGLIISMGANFVSTDNTVIESFHSLLKNGTIHNNKYKTFEQYIDSVHVWNKWYIKHYKK